MPILDGVAAGEGWEILFVDDGSTDATLAAIVAANQRDARVRALSLSRNFGKEAALSAGLDHARGAAVIPMDVDMQDPPEVLPEMVAKWRDGHEMVFGVRRCRDERRLGQAGDRRPLLSRAQCGLGRTRSPRMPATSACSTARWSRSSAPCPSATAS